MLSDGGEVALDWAIAKGSPDQEEDRAKPVLLILPGITGCSQHNYIKYLAKDGLMEGYRPVVFNQRGNGGVPLKVSDFISHERSLGKLFVTFQAPHKQCWYSVYVLNDS